MFIFPFLFGVLSVGGIPFLNHFVGTDIDLGFPWGYIAMFGVGFFGAAILIFIAFLHTKLGFGAVSLEKTSYLLIIYIAILLLSVYFQLKLFIN